jgi:hypothetical protein
MATSASASLTINLNMALYGSLTPKTLNEPVVLPKGSTFTGSATVTKLTEFETEGTIRGNLFVPPFHTELKLVGLVPTDVGVTLTPVGESEGTISTAPAAECAHAKVGLSCVSVAVNSKAIIGLTAAGVLGIELPTHCETTEPVSLALHTTEADAELFAIGEFHFAGTTTIPPIKCEEVLKGPALALLLTTLMSGPDNPYKLGLFVHEPGPPVAETLPAQSVSQISARIRGRAVPNGEPVTACHFEFGTSTEYETSVPCIEAPRQAFPPSGYRQSALMTGLKEGTTYHYRIAATNSLGTSDSTDATFTTLGRAGAPEYGQCVAQRHGGFTEAKCAEKAKRAGQFEWKPGPAPACFAKKKGEYTDAGCTIKSAKQHKGKFEKQAGGPRFTSTSGPLTLEVPGLASGKLVCAGGTGNGEITGTQTAAERVTFTGCEAGGKKCTSEGSNGTAAPGAGTIVTNLLATRLLGPVELPAFEPQVWNQLGSAEHHPYLAEFGCEGPRVRVSGSVSGVQSGDVGVSSVTSALNVSPEEGLQTLVSEVSENGGSSWAAAHGASAAFVQTSTAELAAEIKP